MNVPVVLGVDTSNYTTSVAMVNATDGTLLAEARTLLTVGTGEQGLRQSDAFFQHVQRLPGLVDQLLGQCQIPTHLVWRGIGVSTRPRPRASSYMPVFTAGVRFAEVAARLLHVPLVPTSHQEGHLEAALRSIQVAATKPFLAIHLSGGTSDLVIATPSRFGYHIDPIGEGADLHAGQFVDRVGVALGLPFPAGPHLEHLAAQAPPDSTFRLPSKSIGTHLSFSGPCSAAQRAIAEGIPAAEIADAVLMSIANAVMKALAAALRDYPLDTVVVAGGVAANRQIRQQLIQRMQKRFPAVTVHFARPHLSSDNAYGVAGIALRFLSRS